MGLQLDRVVPWGRSLQEYLGMFNLGSPEELGHLGAGFPVVWILSNRWDALTAALGLGFEG